MSMAAEHETLAAECYPTTLADGVEHHLEGTTTASTSPQRSPSDVISAWTTNASAMP